MKANVNYNLEGDEEPGVFGRAKKVRFTISWGGRKFPGSNCHASKHPYLISFCHTGTPEAPQEINNGRLQSHHAS